MISFFPHCTVLHWAVKPTREVNRDYTVPHLVSGTVIAQYKASASLTDSRPEPLGVTVTDQFYKHVLLYFYLHNEFRWFYVTFYFGKRKETKLQMGHSKV